MDFLGLRNLDVIDKAVELVGGVDIERRSRSTTRRRTRCSRAATPIGVFQFESSGMREALRQVKPTEFEDLIALVALYRPGPDGVHPGLRAPQERPGAGHVHRPAPEAITGDDATGSASTRSSTCRSPSRSPASRPPRRRPAQGDRQEDPRADGVAQGQVPRGLRGERRRRRRSRSSSGRTWSSRRTTPSTRRTRPATR